MQILGYYSFIILIFATFGSIFTNMSRKTLKFKDFGPMVILLLPALIYIGMTIMGGGR